MLKIAVALALAMAVLTAQAFAVPTIAAHTKTVVFDAKSMHVSARQSGYCWVSSIASQRPDAYRCMVGNGIHDPCFKRTERSVACPTDVVDNSGLVIALTKPLPKGNAAGNTWFMRLASGAVCNVGTGTTVPGYPFYCSGAVGDVHLVCSAPPPGRASSTAVFVRCADLVNGQSKLLGSFLVTTLYQ